MLQLFGAMGTEKNVSHENLSHKHMHFAGAKVFQLLYSLKTREHNHIAI